MEKFDHIGRIYFESESCSVVFKSLRLHGLYSPWNSAGQNTGVDSLSLLQGSFPTQGLNLGFSHCRWIIYQLSYQGSPCLCDELAICQLCCCFFKDLQILASEQGQLKTKLWKRPSLFCYSSPWTSYLSLILSFSICNRNWKFPISSPKAPVISGLLLSRSTVVILLPPFYINVYLSNVLFPVPVRNEFLIC